MITYRKATMKSGKRKRYEGKDQISEKAGTTQE
jgi:hypothetical protein